MRIRRRPRHHLIPLRRIRRARRVCCIDIDSLEIRRRPNRLHLLSRKHRRIRTQPLQILVRVFARMHHGQVRRILLHKRLPRRCNVLWRVERRNDRSHIFRRPDPRVLARVRAYRLHCQPMRQHRMMLRLRQLLPADLQTRGMNSIAISQVDERRHLIHRHPVLDQVAELACRIACILSKSLRGLLVLPSASVFECLRQVPVKQRAKRLNPRCQQRLGKYPVVVDALLIRLPCPVRKNPRPRN